MTLHRLHDLAAELRQRPRPEAETPPVHGRAADEPAEDVATKLVRWRDAVRDQERGGTRVLGDDADGNVGRLVLAVGLA